MAAVVIWTLISLYSEGAQIKAQALADSLGQRLSALVAFNININEIGGLAQTFGDYSRLNPDISAAGLSINGRTVIHTDESLIGESWETSRNTYEYVVHLTPPDSPQDIRVAVALPTGVVYKQITRSVKNFAALFVASALFAGLFLQLAGSVRPSERLPSERPPGEGQAAEGPAGEGARQRERDAALNALKPVFFAAVFLEHLNYAFLPQFVYRIVEAAGLSAGFASLPFMAFYLCFALTLVPAGHFAQHQSARPLMYLGLVLAGGGLLLLSVGADFYLVLLARALSGIGQGMLFIGVQSYILTMASPKKRTQGAAIIVFGFQGGMISGMAIGSLLVTYMGPDGVFTLSGVIAFVLAIYALALIPAVPREEVIEARFGFTLSQIAGNLGQVLRSFEFLKTMLLIGIPAKAVLTGVIIFALPVLLSQYRYAQEDIGQIIMIYAAGVVVASLYASRIVDRTGRTQTILFLGSVISGLGLFLIGVIGWLPADAEGGHSSGVTFLLILGVATVGIAHGLINAPVVTHVADSQLAGSVGASSLTATYRFLERLGHIAGPIVGRSIVPGCRAELSGSALDRHGGRGSRVPFCPADFVGAGDPPGRGDSEMMMKRMRHLIGVRFLAALAAFVAFGLLGGLSGAAADEHPSYKEWFRPQEQTFEAWDFIEIEGDGSQVMVQKKNGGNLGPVVPIMVIFPRPSSAYDIAMSKILDVFHEKEINASFLLYNFHKDPARGNEALTLAKRQGYELIFSMGSESTAWLWKNYRGGEIPVVSVCSKDPVVARPVARLRRRYRHQLCLHFPEHAY